MLPEKLKAFLNDDMFIRIEEVLFGAGSITIHLVVRDEDAEQRWQVRRAGVLEHVFSSVSIDDIEVYTDHPRMWAYMGESTSLYFSGLPLDTARLAMDLVRTHYAVCGTDIPLDTYLMCQQGDVEALCAARYGLLANGPLRILDRYADCLREANVKCSFIGTREAMAWTVDGWQVISKMPIMLSFGASWVIATDLEWEELSSARS